MVSAPKLLRRQQRHVEARARALERQLSRWMRRYSQAVLARELKERKLVAKGAAKENHERVVKAGTRTVFEDIYSPDCDAGTCGCEAGECRPVESRQHEVDVFVKVDDRDTGALLDLERILRLHGLRAATDAARRAGWADVEAGALLEALQSKEILVQGLASDIRGAVRESIRTVITDASREVPRPTAGEIARRIRTQYHGPVDAMPTAINSERAALIARTELVQAENTGIMLGYEATGVDEIEWLSYPNDGRSGKRMHWDMDGTVIEVGGYFITPLGNKLRYPGDPSGDIEDTANCRCTIAPVRSARAKKGSQ